MPALISSNTRDASSGTRFALAVKSVDSVRRSEQFIHTLTGERCSKVIALEEHFQPQRDDRSMRQSELQA